MYLLYSPDCASFFLMVSYASVPWESCIVILPELIHLAQKVFFFPPRNHKSERWQGVPRSPYSFSYYILQLRVCSIQLYLLLVWLWKNFTGAYHWKSMGGKWTKICCNFVHIITVNINKIVILKLVIILN